MKILRIIVLSLLVAFAMNLSYAEEARFDEAAAQMQNAPSVSTVSMEFDGLQFSVPFGMKVERGESLTAIYPDGTFGLTMAPESHPSTKKIAFNLCKRLADTLGLPRTQVKKRNFGSAKGAYAQGMVDGMYVMCVVLTYENHQMQITVMAKPERKEWVNNFLNSLNRD